MNIYHVTVIRPSESLAHESYEFEVRVFDVAKKMNPASADKLVEDLKASGCTVIKHQLFPELEENGGSYD